MRPVCVAGLGGSLRELSTSRTALQIALEGAAASGADVELIWVRDLGLPLYTDEQSFDPDGHLKDEAIAAQLRKLGAEVVRAARQFQTDGTCDYAEGTSIGPASHRPASRPGAYPGTVNDGSSA